MWPPKCFSIALSDTLIFDRYLSSRGDRGVNTRVSTSECARAYYDIVVIALLHSHVAGVGARSWYFWSVKNHEKWSTACRRPASVPWGFNSAGVAAALPSAGSFTVRRPGESARARHPLYLLFQPFDAVTGREYAANGPWHEESRRDPVGARDHFPHHADRPGRGNGSLGSQSRAGRDVNILPRYFSASRLRERSRLLYFHCPVRPHPSLQFTHFSN